MADSTQEGKADNDRKTAASTSGDTSDRTSDTSTQETCSVNDTGLVHPSLQQCSEQRTHKGHIDDLHKGQIDDLDQGHGEGPSNQTENLFTGRSSSDEKNPESQNNINSLGDAAIRRRNIQTGSDTVSESAGTTAGVQWNQSNDSSRDVLPECVVCQTRRVMCVLLPCRHACVCLACFKLLDKCPLCRAPLESYFLLEDVVAEVEDGEINEDIVLEEIHQQAVRTSLGQAWEDFNDRLNHWLGFR